MAALQRRRLTAGKPLTLNMGGMNNVTIRPITAEDADGFHRCLDLVARESKFLALLEAPPLDTVRAFVAGNVQNGVPQVVAIDEGHVVGWCDIQSAWHPTLKHAGSLGMGLLPPYRGQRLGERLFQACLALAMKQGMTRIELEARVDNVAAIALYKRLGFQHEGLKLRGMRVDGAYINTVMMALLLPSSD